MAKKSKTSDQNERSSVAAVDGECVIGLVVRRMKASLNLAKVFYKYKHWNFGSSEE